MAARSAKDRPATLLAAVKEYVAQAEKIRQGAGRSGIERQHRRARLTARERIDRLLDTGSSRFECGLFAAWNMYQEYGGAPAAGLVTTVGQVGGKIGIAAILFLDHTILVIPKL